MGRHSAASDDDSEESAAASSSVAVVEVDVDVDDDDDRPSGRHSALPATADPVADPVAVADPVRESESTAPESSAPVSTAPLAPARKSGGHATAADIALIRAHGDVRARAVAAVLIPFVVYAVYQLIVGDISSRPFLVWLWIPVIVAGVLFGLTLDAGHKRYGSSGSSGPGSSDA